MFDRTGNYIFEKVNVIELTGLLGVDVSFLMTLISR